MVSVNSRMTEIRFGLFDRIARRGCSRQFESVAGRRKLLRLFCCVDDVDWQPVN